MLSSIGLSLCIQGTLEIENIYSIKQRFIPVHTGNMWGRSIYTWWRTVYPCAYREHQSKSHQSYIFVGLSLCIQGTSSPIRKFVRFVRFIPVHTGNIVILKLVNINTSVYPCAYREHCSFLDVHWIVNGLSLCIQGTLTHAVLRTQQVRFIPVHTGNMPTTNNEPRTNPGLSLCIQGT